MTDSPKPTRKRDGRLREDLIDAGVALLRDRGADGMSLRECAAIAGVSHASPGYHFGNLKGLKTAIAARAFRLFGDFMLEFLAKAERAPKAQILAISEGYLAFAEAHKELFLFMFSGQDLDQTDPDLSAMSARAYQILRDTCAPFVKPDSHPETVEILVWSLVHGYAQLMLTGKIRKASPGVKIPAYKFLLDHLNLSLQDDPSSSS
ncbi:TetR/AcrR family transcriptional regulator [Roseibium suaedae]|uniref:Transcriptional regulator, TetR family n=1 Tax=Roseibium suaedae TaxID=735517 RepID=A0A1M7FN66_9HYPH|nr:WHG domain-containing protein [Roseibium suaedae]SHM05446.1 transcriptional regulator, TetR family [Roseibium suaedae]